VTYNVRTLYNVDFTLSSLVFTSHYKISFHSLVFREATKPKTSKQKSRDKAKAPSRAQQPHL